jgi:hypothetical protein
MDCDGLGLSANTIEELVEQTGPQGPHKLGYTFSDIRTRLLPEALSQAYPSRKIRQEDFAEAIRRVQPSPSVHTTIEGK